MREVYSESIEDNEEILKHHRDGKPDFYSVLGVDRGASQAELQQAHRSMSRQYHPDVSDHPDAEGKIREVNMARDVLLDEQARAEYDQLLGMMDYSRQQTRQQRPQAPKEEWYAFPGDDAYSRLINEAMRRVRGRKVRMKFDTNEAAILGDRGFRELDTWSNFNKMYARARRQRDGTVFVDFGPL